MKKIIIISYTAKSEGVILETNIPARLKPNRMASKETFVSWDSIGELLFENYTYEIEVSELDKLRNKHMKPLPTEQPKETDFKSKVIELIEKRIQKINEIMEQHVKDEQFLLESAWQNYKTESNEILNRIKQL